MSYDFLLYGANGYTGRLILQRALRLGMRPLPAGRNAEIVTFAGEHGLDHRIFGTDDVPRLDSAVSSVPVVLNAAGPFEQTAAPVVQACLRTGTHYIDITGEINVFESLHALHDSAVAAGLMLLPGAGFDVVPSDLLAAHLKRRLPDAVKLRLAFMGVGGGISRGTAATMVENIGRGGVVRQDGRLVRVPAAWHTCRIDFGFGTRPVDVTTIPWGDVSTAYHSTGIPDIRVYTRMTATQRRLLVGARQLGWLLRSAPVQRLLGTAVRARSPGPSAERRQHGRTLLWGQVEAADGRRAVSRMRTPEAYALTAVVAVEAVRRVLDGNAPPGFQTPSTFAGADWILAVEGVERSDDATGR